MTKHWWVFWFDYSARATERKGSRHGRTGEEPVPPGPQRKPKVSHLVGYEVSAWGGLNQLEFLHGRVGVHAPGGPQGRDEDAEIGREGHGTAVKERRREDGRAVDQDGAAGQGLQESDGHYRPAVVSRLLDRGCVRSISLQHQSSLRVLAGQD